MMGKGIEIARPGAPEHAAMMDDFKDQLLIALVRKIAAQSGDETSEVAVRVEQVDRTGEVILMMRVDQVEKVFYFQVARKQ